MRSLQSCASLVSAKNLDKDVCGAQSCILVEVWKSGTQLCKMLQLLSDLFANQFIC